MQSHLKYLMLTLLGMSLSGCVTTGLTGVQRSLSDTPWGYQIVQSPHPVYLGKKSQRFEVRPGDCSANSGWNDCKTDRERSEVTATSARFPLGSQNWISFLIYLPEDFETSNSVNADLGQIYMRGGFSGYAGGFRSFPPLLQLNAIGKIYTACFHMLSGTEDQIQDHCESRLIANLADMRGKWSRITIHLDAKQKAPAVRIFFNGAQVAAFSQTLSRDPQEYYLKYGIYRSFVSRHGKPMPTQVVYYDEVKTGSTRAEVEDETAVID